MKNIITLALTLGVVYNSVCQDFTKDTVYLSILEDNPNFTFFNFGIDIFNISFDNNAMPIGTGATFGFAMESIYGGVNYQRGGELISSQEDLGQYSARSIYGGGYNNETHGTRNDFSSFIGYAVKTNKKKKSKTLRLKDEGRVSYVTEVDATEKSQYCIETGFNTGYTYYQASLGEGMRGIPYGPDNQLSNYASEELNVSTVFQFTTIQLGFAFNRRHDIVAKAKGFGDRRSNGFTRFYARLNYLVSSNLDDVIKPANQMSLSDDSHFMYNLNEANEMNKIGLNIGFSYAPIKKFGWHATAELGIAPGPKLGIRKNAYLFLKCGVSLAALFKK